MAFSGIRSLSAGSGDLRRLTVKAHGGYFLLPQTSVVISDRTRHANKLGEGSFAKVYRGAYNGKPCAVKVLKEDIVKKELSPDAEGTSEIEMLSKVLHTNIVQIYGIWFDPHKDRAAPSIVMELCDESLYDFIRRFKGKGVPKEKKLSILQGIARGMVYLHGQNIVHGDLRSSNVLLCHSEDQTVAKIADFDMTRFLDPHTQHHFTVRFTAEEYLPPEVFDHKEHKDQKKWARLTPKVDAFCFGELVLEMACGTYPTPTGKFKGAKMLTELQRREKHLVKLKQSDKESLGSVIRKCLADAPEFRPSFTEILLEIEGYLHMYGERPDLEVLQDKTAECEALRAEAVKWEGEAKSLSSMQDVLETELEKEKAEKEDLQINVLIHQTRVEELPLIQEALDMKTNEHAEVLKEVASLKEALEQQAGNIGELQSQSHDQVKVIQELNRDRLSVQQEVEQLKSKRDAFKQKLDDAQEALYKKRNEHAEAMEEVVCLKKALEQKATKADEVDVQLKKERLECNALQQQNAELKKAVKTFETTLGAMQETVTELEQSRWELCTQLKELKAENEAAKTQQKSDNMKMSSLQVALQAEKDKSCNAEETMRQKEKEVKKCNADLQAEKDQVHTMQKAALQKEKDLEQCRTELKSLKAKKRHQQDALMAELQERLAKAQRNEQDLNDQLCQYRDKLEATEKDLEANVGKLRKMEEKIAEAMEAQKILEEEREQKILAIRKREKELEEVTAGFAKERQQFLARIAAGEEAKRSLEARKTVVEKDLVRARKMAKDLLDERVVVNAESEQKRENLNEKLMKFKQQAVLSEERLKQVQCLEGEQWDLKIQLKTLTTTLEDFQKVLTDEQKSCKSLDASVKALMAEIDQLRTELKERDNEVSSLAAANKHFQRKVDAADANNGEMKTEIDHLSTELKERENEVKSLAAANGGLQGKVDAADAKITEMKAESTSLKEQVKSLSNDKMSLKQTLDATEAAIRKHKNDYEDCQEKLREAEQQVALFQGKRQQLEVLESVTAELKSQLSGLMMDAPPLLAPIGSGGEDESSATAQAAQKVQQLESERDSLKAERYMYQMKWLATEDMLKTMKNDRKSLEDERDSLQRRKETLEQDRGSMMAKITGLEEKQTVEQDKLQKAQDDRESLLHAKDTLEREKKDIMVKKTGLEEELRVKQEILMETKDERDSLLRTKDTLEQEKKDVMAKKTILEEELRVKHEDLEKTKESLELSRLALRGAKVHLEVTEQSLREEYKRKNSEAYEVIKRLQHHPQEGSAEYPSEKTKISALMDLCKYFRDENMETLERAAEEKQKIHASMKEADERVKEMTSTIAALKECIQVQDAEVRDLQAQLVPHQGMAVVPVPPPSDVADLTGDEVVLEQLCYMATGVKQLLISPDGGTFTLGSGDASLEFPPGAIVEETSVRYAIILHGPFVFPAGYKPGSVVIYLNMDGANLLKPVLLHLSHWCIKEKGEDEDTLKFVSASHTLEAGQQVYVFEEEDDADFTRTNVGVLSIRDPHCLYCVETKRETVAMYSAIAFSHYIPSEETLLFRIQLMCDSLEWNEKLTTTLQLKNWEKTSDGDVVTQFQYADGQHQITASPIGMAGPGWEAAIYGQQGVIDQKFLRPLQKSKVEVEQEVISGRFPPCILYKIIYSSPEEKRIRPALLKVDLNGADVPLFFSCRIKEMYPTSPVSSAFFSTATSPHTPDRMAASYGPSRATPGHIPSAERHPSSPQAEISRPTDVIEALNHELDARWREFGTHMCVKPTSMDSIDKDNKSDVGACMLQLVEKWLAPENGTGDLPRTWETVVQAVKKTGLGRLAEELAEKHGVQLSGQ